MASSRRICKSAPMKKSDSVVEALEELRRERARHFEGGRRIPPLAVILIDYGAGAVVWRFLRCTASASGTNQAAVSFNN